MEIRPFTFSGGPRTIYGEGEISGLPLQIKRFGEKIILVTGKSSLISSGAFSKIINQLEKENIRFIHHTVEEEPSPSLIDEITGEFKEGEIDAVVSIGGGSVIDAGKAVSAMLGKKEPVTIYLEGVGSGKPHDGTRVPHIAVPTTAGTGSEATKNAVLCRRGSGGFKKSLRHENFIPDTAILDPLLTLECPPEITAASGLDAITQLLGSYLSTQASPYTDALSLYGLKLAIESLLPVSTDRADDINLRGKMLMAASISGVALANAGLGIVHGLASVIGGMFDIPHGVICGTLVGEAVKTNILALMESGEKVPLEKYCRVGSLMSDCRPDDREGCCDALVLTLEEWTGRLHMPGLGKYGVKEDDLERIADAASNKNNPVLLSKEQIKTILRNRL